MTLALKVAAAVVLYFVLGFAIGRWVHRRLEEEW